jgi:hypothetical protein
MADGGDRTAAAAHELGPAAAAAGQQPPPLNPNAHVSFQGNAQSITMGRRCSPPPRRQ